MPTAEGKDKNSIAGLPHEVAYAMRHIYHMGLTTTSGGNLSVRGQQGEVVITPAGTDKGRMSHEEVVCLSPDGSIIGSGRPSSEYPLHLELYRARPDLGAVIHAHPPALTSFSIVGRVPDTTVLRSAAALCGTVGYAPYMLPGTSDLAAIVAARFREGSDAVIMQNHAVVVAGKSLEEALIRLEVLENCAMAIQAAAALGSVRSAGRRALEEYEAATVEMRVKGMIHEAVAGERNVKGERCQAARVEMRVKGSAGGVMVREHTEELRAIAERAYGRRVLCSGGGSLSVRGDDGFIINPEGVPFHRLSNDNIARVGSNRQRVQGEPARDAWIHEAVYRSHRQIRSVIVAQPPCLMAFAVTGRAPEVKTIPESWIFLQEMPLVPFRNMVTERESLFDGLSADAPAMLIENDSVVITGESLLQAFDRLEVAEMTAMSLIFARALGETMLISDEEIAKLRRRFIRREQ